jgi:UDP-glucose 4-epimerase
VVTLITGGIGWVPSHIALSLAASGEPVVTFDLMPPDDLFNELIAPVREIVVTASGDVTDPERLASVCHKYRITRIVHAAAITPRREREMAEPERIISVNLGGLVNVLAHARENPDIERVLFISSEAALGAVVNVTRTDEETLSAAVGLYGVLKHTGERIVRRYRDLFDMDVLSVRLANVYGPMERNTPGYIGATELREMLRIHFAGERVRINSLNGPWLDWTYVTDIADGVRVLMEADRPTQNLYTITCGQLFSIGDVLEAFTRYLPGFGYDLVDSAEANYHVAGGGPGPVPSNQRMADEFGWTPPTSFDDGMKRYLTWIAQHGPQ